METTKRPVFVLAIDLDEQWEQELCCDPGDTIYDPDGFVPILAEHQEEIVKLLRKHNYFDGMSEEDIEQKVIFGFFDPKQVTKQKHPKCTAERQRADDENVDKYPNG
jgi:hypothetical protein